MDSVDDRAGSKYYYSSDFWGYGDDRAGGRDDTRSVRIVEGSTLHAVGTFEEKLYFDQAGKDRKVDRDWWGIFAESGPKIRLEHAKVSGDYYGLYFQDLGRLKQTPCIYVIIFLKTWRSSYSYGMDILGNKYRCQP